MGEGGAGAGAEGEGDGDGERGGEGCSETWQIILELPDHIRNIIKDLKPCHPTYAALHKREASPLCVNNGFLRGTEIRCKLKIQTRRVSCVLMHLRKYSRRYHERKRAVPAWLLLLNR